jgi:hypothetical protein
MQVDAFDELDAGGRATGRRCYTAVGDEPEDTEDTGTCKWYRLEPQATHSVTSGIEAVILRDGFFLNGGGFAPRQDRRTFIHLASR